MSSNPNENDNTRRSFLKTAAKGSIAVLSLSGIAASALAADELHTKAPAAIKPDHVVRSVPENMVWGYYGADIPPVAKVKNGDIVEIQTINTTGITRRDPE